MPNEPLEEGFGIFRGTSPLLQPEELEQLNAQEWASYPWRKLVERIAKAPADRLAAAQSWLAERRGSVIGDQRARRGRGWGKNQERDQIIRNCLERGSGRQEICQELDKRTIETIPQLRKMNIHRWNDGWQDTEARKAIQRLFSKVRQKAVKSPVPAE